MPITALDHLVLTVRDPTAARCFYCDGLGTRWTVFGEGREALSFGRQKINLHRVGRELEPRALRATPGSADVCLLTDEALGDVAARMRSLGFVPIGGPVRRAGAVAVLESLYFRDPDGNLVEVSREAPERA